MLRPYWRHYYTGTQGLVFVLDSTDESKLPAVLSELQILAVDEQLRDIPFVVFANKTDNLNILITQNHFEEKLNLGNILKGRTWKLILGSAKTGEGCEEAISFLVSTMKQW
jgi:signal recognition particle receptor subunit beta